MSTRSPIIAILGHVDHGKTTLLDAIRKTEVAAHEHGGITQSIGAYQAGGITFLDTPGHEAFLSMRSRGALAADIAVLVVAADDSVMPQTVESIKIIQEVKIPYIVAINKTDLPEANINKVIQDLLRHHVLLEGYGGEVPFVKISAKTGAGLKDLLGLISLLAEVNGIGTNLSGNLDAVIVESKLDKGQGPVATAIIRDGQLSVGDKIFAGVIEGKVRALINHSGQSLSSASAGMPVEIVGFTKIPPVGKKITTTIGYVNCPDIKRNLGVSTLKIVLKADTLGSQEAVCAKLSDNICLLDAGVGEISEKDILLAKNSQAIVVGFNVKINHTAAKLAETEKVLVRTYKIIYELLEELDDAAAGVLEIKTEKILGTGKIIAQFPFEGLKICGVKVFDGRLARGDHVRIRSVESKIKSLRISKNEVNKVEVGQECGVLLDPQIDFNLGDDIMAYSPYV